MFTRVGTSPADRLQRATKLNIEVVKRSLKMCDVIIPALIGVGALALLGGGGGAVAGGCDNCPTGPACAVTQYGNYTVTIPQLAGEGTNVMQVPAQDQFAYAPPMQHAPYAGQAAGPAPHMAHAGYAAPAPAPAYGGIGHYDADPAAAYGASAVAGNEGIGAGAYANPNGVGLGANVGGFDAGVDVGARAY
jgi:hypothetical protein